jgi:predicted AlkP superfamily pyrophosphatase or phosphodiesterase
MINPAAQPDIRKKVRDLLDRLAKDPNSGIDSVLNREEIQKQGGNPHAEFAVALKSGYCLGDAITGSLVAPPFVRGMHGFLPSNHDMDSSFFIVGPGIPAAHSLGNINMLDIAPTLAAILGVPFPSAEGHDLSVTKP